ncbi:SH3 domain-containing protein [Roseococcus microcysteis]|uniref:SH3 domain-containing protein n=1 Tax=Roseococcus microcysteis TaxID=2771361 RepID=UPI0038CD51D6
MNLRVGPGLRFPVEWRYQRADLPVMIVREHEEWRRVRDPDGTEGWLAASTLRPGRRTFIVRQPQPGVTPATTAPAAGEVLLRRRPEEGGAAVARLQPGVIGRLRLCEAGSEWCEVQVQNRRGYVRRAEIFGVLPDEEFR